MRFAFYFRSVWQKWLMPHVLQTQWKNDRQPWATCAPWRVSCTWTLESQPLQFGQPVDIDIDSQTSIQPQCIYMSRPLGDVGIALSVCTWCNGKTLHLRARTRFVSRRARAKIIARCTCTVGTHLCHVKKNEVYSPSERTLAKQKQKKKLTDLSFPTWYNFKINK